MLNASSGEAEETSVLTGNDQIIANSGVDTNECEVYSCGRDPHHGDDSSFSKKVVMEFVREQSCACFADADSCDETLPGWFVRRVAHVSSTDIDLDFLHLLI